VGAYDDPQALEALAEYSDVITYEFENVPATTVGLLVSMGGRSHLVYAKEEPSGLRLVLDGATCQFTNEYDPTALRAPMSGKLVRYLVEEEVLEVLEISMLKVFGGLQPLTHLILIKLM
jgi:hypothetical protein